MIFTVYVIGIETSLLAHAAEDLTAAPAGGAALPDPLQGDAR